MHFIGYYNAATGAWLDNDFQWPHFPDIHALIAACYPSVEAFTAAHGAAWTIPAGVVWEAL